MSQSSSQSSQSPRHIDQQGIEPRGDARLLADLASTPSPSPAQPSFTPGPWTFKESLGTSNSYKIEGEGLSVRIYGRDCHLPNGHHLKVGRTQANARLIAASPAMYAALVELLNAIHDSMTHESQRFHAEQIESAYAALAQAEGKQ